jgi:PRTRC genetic system ThiF family protein
MTTRIQSVHKLNPDFLTKRIDVLLVGAGGNGCRMLTGLAELNKALVSLGHPHGLHVTVMDSDLVSESNIGRQAFFQSDIGLNKADVLVYRVNSAYQLEWVAIPARLENKRSFDYSRYHLVVGAVDSRSSRRAIAEFCANKYVDYWLDLGNFEDIGQIILGQTEYSFRRGDGINQRRLPTIVDLFPDILDESVEEEDSPSCSVADALQKQSLFINRAVSDSALNILWRLFRYGELDYHGQFINLKSGIASPLAVDTEAWKRFGYKAVAKRATKRKSAP